MAAAVHLVNAAHDWLTTEAAATQTVFGVVKMNCFTNVGNTLRVPASRHYAVVI